MNPVEEQRDEIVELRRELRDTNEREAAVHDVVQTIAQSTVDLDVVLQTVIDRAVRLCRADNGNIARQGDAGSDRVRRPLRVRRDRERRILAARLSDAAASGEILLSQRTHAALEDRVVAEPVDELPLKGFTRPVKAVRATAVRG